MLSISCRHWYKPVFRSSLFNSLEIEWKKSRSSFKVCLMANSTVQSISKNYFDITKYIQIDVKNGAMLLVVLSPPQKCVYNSYGSGTAQSQHHLVTFHLK